MGEWGLRIEELSTRADQCFNLEEITDHYLPFSERAKGAAGSIDIAGVAVDKGFRDFSGLTLSPGYIILPFRELTDIVLENRTAVAAHLGRGKDGPCLLTNRIAKERLMMLGG